MLESYLERYQVYPLNFWSNTVTLPCIGNALQRNATVNRKFTLHTTENKLLQGNLHALGVRKTSVLIASDNTNVLNLLMVYYLYI